MANVGVIRYDAGAKAFYVDIPAKDSPTGKREKIFSIPVLGGRLLPCKSEGGSAGVQGYDLAARRSKS